MLKILRKLALPVFLFTILALTIPISQLIYSQSIAITEKKVAYELPYPGILPDHPLYFLKSWRDRLLEFLSRDDLKKTEFYINLSDRDISTGSFLVKKGKNKLAVATLKEAENYSEKIPTILRRSRQQGVSPSAQLIERVKLSNNKHRETIEQLLKDIPQGDQQGVEDVVRMNEKVKQEIDSF